MLLPKIIQLSIWCKNDVVERSKTNTNFIATKCMRIVVHQTCVHFYVCWLNKCFTKYRWSSPERIIPCNNLSPQISQVYDFFSKSLKTFLSGMKELKTFKANACYYKLLFWCNLWKTTYTILVQNSSSPLRYPLDPLQRYNLFWNSACLSVSGWSLY